MGLSFELLSQSNAQNQTELERFAHWCVGAKGLIAGQVYDLAASSPTYEEVRRIHELKTGRLILLSTLAPYFFLDSEDSHLFKKLWKLGTHLGRYFQLKDDFDDYNQTPDDDLNIFKIDEARAIEELRQSEGKLQEALHGFPKVQDLLKLLK